jgi:hypothetical protein
MREMANIVDDESRPLATAYSDFIVAMMELTDLCRNFSIYPKKEMDNMYYKASKITNPVMDFLYQNGQSIPKQQLVTDCKALLSIAAPLIVRLTDGVRNRDKPYPINPKRFDQAVNNYSESFKGLIALLK